LSIHEINAFNLITLSAPFSRKALAALPWVPVFEHIPHLLDVTLCR